MNYTLKKSIFNLCIFCICAFITAAGYSQQLSPEEILDKVDKNMVAETVISSSKMVIHQKNRVDEKEMRIWGKGDKTSFVEFVSPARDKGTKYLRIDNNLWMFLPNIEETVKISGHLLRQSMMGSDFSYEDSMNRLSLREKYDSVLLEDQTFNEKLCYVIELTANQKDVTYYRRKVWVDKEQFVPLKSELYANTGKLMKEMTVQKIEIIGGKNYPTHMIMRDMLRKNSYTELIMTDVQFDVDIPDNIFTLRNLERR
ncbi:outer membrane lipoprotein-sorting protein [candidate division KSB1 bacterium]